MINHVSDLVRSDGWETALFQLSLNHVIANGRLPEDQRVADWRFLLPSIGQSSVLILGCGWGTIAVALAETSQAVYVVDSNWEALSLLNIRKNQLGLRNIHCICMDACLDLSFGAEAFDLVVLNDCSGVDGKAIRFRDLATKIRDALREDGFAYFKVHNRLSYEHVLGRHNCSSLSSHTLYGFRQILAELNFTETSFFAPLPKIDGVPLFYVPLDDIQAMTFFFSDLFSLFDMVSPEVKQVYALELFLTRLGVRIALRLGLVGLTKFFLSGYSILTQVKKS